ncbi:hypothetical protein HDU77_009104 [Chytriomyces hyalinus]|nr:hypothetical protein HDU77_009104 [Chytriomyces hyalinus]
MSDRDYAPLTLAIQNDKLRCTMGSAEILKQLTELARLQSYNIKPVKAKIMGQRSGKRAAKDLDLRDKKQPKMAFYCSHHKGNNSHSIEDFPDTPDEHMLVDTPSKGITEEPSEVLSDDESDFSEIRPEDYMIPDYVESEFSEYLSDQETQTPVYLSVETKEQLEKWEKE